MASALRPITALFQVVDELIQSVDRVKDNAVQIDRTVAYGHQVLDLICFELEKKEIVQQSNGLGIQTNRSYPFDQLPQPIGEYCTKLHSTLLDIQNYKDIYDTKKIHHKILKSLKHTRKLDNYEHTLRDLIQLIKGHYQVIHHDLMLQKQKEPKMVQQLLNEPRNSNNQLQQPSELYSRRNPDAQLRIESLAQKQRENDQFFQNMLQSYSRNLNKDEIEYETIKEVEWLSKNKPHPIYPVQVKPVFDRFPGISKSPIHKEVELDEQLINSLDALNYEHVTVSTDYELSEIPAPRKSSSTQSEKSAHFVESKRNSLQSDQFFNFGPYSNNTEAISPSKSNRSKLAKPSYSPKPQSKITKSDFANNMLKSHPSLEQSIISTSDRLSVAAVELDKEDDSTNASCRNDNSSPTEPLSSPTADKPFTSSPQLSPDSNHIGTNHRKSVHSIVINEPLFFHPSQELSSSINESNITDEATYSTINSVLSSSTTKSLQIPGNPTLGARDSKGNQVIVSNGENSELVNDDKLSDSKSNAGSEVGRALAEKDPVSLVQNIIGAVSSNTEKVDATGTANFGLVTSANREDDKLLDIEPLEFVATVPNTKVDLDALLIDFDNSLPRTSENNVTAEVQAPKPEEPPKQDSRVDVEETKHQDNDQPQSADKGESQKSVENIQEEHHPGIQSKDRNRLSVETAQDDHYPDVILNDPNQPALYDDQYYDYNQQGYYDNQYCDPNFYYYDPNYQQYYYYPPVSESKSQPNTPSIQAVKSPGDRPQSMILNSTTASELSAPYYTGPNYALARPPAQTEKLVRPTIYKPNDKARPNSMISTLSGFSDKSKQFASRLNNPFTSQSQLNPVSRSNSHSLDMNTQFNTVQRYADNGDSDAMFELAKRYASTKSECDMSKAVDYLSKASKLGHEEASVALGKVYLRGEGGIKRDVNKAISYLRVAQRNPSALNALGRCYELRKQYGEAFKCFITASEFGHASSLLNVGLCYSSGRGVEQDCKSAKSYFEYAAELGNGLAHKILGTAYLNGDLGLQKDYLKGFQHFQSSLQCGCPDSHINIAECYQNGVGVDQSNELAFEHYKLAAQAKPFNPESQYKFGQIYEQGLLCEQNYTRAIYWYAASAKLDYGPSAFRLGYIYENGYGVEKDLKRAYGMYCHAAESTRTPVLEAKKCAEKIKPTRISQVLSYFGN
eukprot:NODE_23_length_38171_cov_0.318108.p1 type:complete len:1187 gc:universal NODE_23_length_38171_cov_0.318108:3154-6714(+)